MELIQLVGGNTLTLTLVMANMYIPIFIKEFYNLGL